MEPIRHIGRIQLSDLQEVDTQKERFTRNLAQFVAGRTANNVLLTGARGTGKSSLVRAARPVVKPKAAADRVDRVMVASPVELQG